MSYPPACYCAMRRAAGIGEGEGGEGSKGIDNRHPDTRTEPIPRPRHRHRQQRSRRGVGCSRTTRLKRTSSSTAMCNSLVSSFFSFVLFFLPIPFPPPSPSIAHDNTTEPMQRNATGYYCTYMYVLHACMHACMDLHIRPHTNLFSTSLLGRLCGRRDRSVDLRIQPQMHAWPARAAAAAAATLLQGLSSDCPDREEARPADRGAACSAGTPLNVL